MRGHKKIGLRIFFIIELIVFVTLYLGGPEGMRWIRKKQEENKQFALKIENLSLEIKKLEAEIQKWEHNHFYQEKIAREQLQMARPTDEVYRIT